jgi:putative transcriptional regulator
MFGRSTDIIGLMNTVSGQIDPAFTLLSDTQASLLGVRSGNAGIADTLGGIALEAECPASISASFINKTMAKIDAYEATNEKARLAAMSAGNALEELLSLPYPLRDLCLESAGDSGWSFSAPGVKSMVLKTGGKLPTRLLRIEPGRGAPNHDHTGTEYTLVVKGAFYDGTGYFGPGDLSIKRVGQIHHPVAQADEVCFALTVEEGEVAFFGVLGVLQRLFTRH